MIQATTDTPGRRKRRRQRPVEVRLVIDFRINGSAVGGLAGPTSATAFVTPMDGVATVPLTVATVPPSMDGPPVFNSSTDEFDSENGPIDSQKAGSDSRTAPNCSQTAPIHSSGPPDESPCFLDLFKSRYEPEVLSLECKASTVSGYATAVNHFVQWWRQKYLRSLGPTVSDLSQSPTVLSSWFSDMCAGPGRLKTHQNKLKYVQTVWRTMAEFGWMDSGPPPVRKRAIQKQQKVDKSVPFPVPAHDSEVDAMLQACVDLGDHLTWPKLGDVPPWEFWWNAIAICAVHGIRPADFWPLERKMGDGLLWSEVSLAPSPPIPGGNKLQADWEFGWLNLEMNKTGKRLLSPMSPHLAWLIQRCQGLDERRVWPLKYCGKSWYSSIHKIVDVCQFDRVVSLCGAAPHASLRKFAAVHWSRHAGDWAASLMLGHAVRTGTSADVGSSDGSNDVSAITLEHYSKSDKLRQVVEAFPTVLSQLPRLIRC